MKRKYCGTYPVRKISRNESVIHMPNEVTGDFAIMVQDDGDVLLAVVGKKGEE